MKISNAQIENYIDKIAAEKIAGALIFGPDNSVITDRAKRIAKKITPDLTDQFLVVNLSKERLSLEPSCLIDEFYSISMLGGRKLIMISNADAQAASALKLLLEEKNLTQKSENFILIQAGDLEKNSSLRKQAEENQHLAAIACYEDDERVIKKFIESELTKNQLACDTQIVNYLYEKLGKNRQIIALEIAKIALYLDGDDITVALIDKAIDENSAFSSDDFIFSFVEQNQALTQKYAQYLLNNGHEIIGLIRFLSNYLQKLYHAKKSIDLAKSSFEEAVKAQRLFFKTEAQFRKHLKMRDLSWLNSQLNFMQDLEVAIKTKSAIDSKILFLQFLNFAPKKID